MLGCIFIGVITFAAKTNADPDGVCKGNTCEHAFRAQELLQRQAVSTISALDDESDDVDGENSSDTHNLHAKENNSFHEKSGVENHEDSKKWWEQILSPGIVPTIRRRRAPLRRRRTAAPTLEPTPAPTPSPTPALMDDDYCLQRADGWKPDSRCSTATHWCQGYGKDMQRCCPVSCGTDELTEANCNVLIALGSCVYPRPQACVDETGWTDHEFGSGTSGCADGDKGGFLANPQWCIGKTHASKEARRACPLSCGLCSQATCIADFVDQDLEGTDVSQVVATGSTSAELDGSCCNQCNADGNCEFWVRLDSQCWLKRDAGAYTESSGFTGGHKQA